MNIFRSSPDSSKDASSEDIRRLRQDLLKFGASNISSHQRDDLKQHLMGLIASHPQQERLPSGLERLGLKIQDLASKISLSLSERVGIKERVFAAIENASFHEVAFGSKKVFRYFKTVLSSVLLFFFVVTTVVVFPLQVPLLHAASSTYIDELQGKVFVLRAGQLYTAKKDFSLQEGDILLTKDNSFAVIRFFDDSVSRLDANTQLELKRIYAEPFNPIATQVELLLTQGRLWTRVLNLIDDRSHFVVDTAYAAAVVSKKAAFDLQTHFSTTSLAVFDNVVDFTLHDHSREETKPVLSGFSAEVSSFGKVNMNKIATTDLKSGSDWVQSNLKRDKIHDELIVQEKESALESTQIADVRLLAVKSFDEKAVLTDPELEQKRLAFLDSYRQLLLGETFLMRGQNKQGLPLILGFKEAVRTLVASLEDFKDKDPLNVGLLRSLIEAKISEQRKDFSNFLPWDPLYPAKQLLEETELLLARDDIAMAQLQFSQAESKLFELQNMVANSKFDEAAVMLIRYKRQINDITMKVDAKNLDLVVDRLSNIFDQQVEQMKVLTVLEKSLHDDNGHLLSEVRKVRHNILQQLVDNLKAFRSHAPVDVLKDLKGLLETYATENGQYDKLFVDLLNRMLVASDQQEQQKDEAPIIVEPTVPLTLPKDTTVQDQLPAKEVGENTVPEVEEKPVSSPLVSEPL